MRWMGLTCLLVVILGVVLFLYGSNYYDYIVGWAGVYLFVGGIIAYVLLRVFRHPAKSVPDQKP
jgi:FtsH-binding integral membrane protein